MGLDDEVVEKMNRDITSNPATAHHTMLLMPEDLNARHQVTYLVFFRASDIKISISGTKCIVNEYSFSPVIICFFSIMRILEPRRL